MSPSSSITKVDCPNSPGILMDVVIVAFSAVISYLNVFASGSYSGLKSSITPKSCLCSHHHLESETALGGSTAKLFVPILQLPIKSVVLADPTILSGLSENNIVLSDTSLNSSVEVVAFTSDTEPDCAPWINKNFAPVIFLSLRRHIVCRLDKRTSIPKVIANPKITNCILAEFITGL